MKRLRAVRTPDRTCFCFESVQKKENQVSYQVFFFYLLNIFNDVINIDHYNYQI